MKNKTIRTIYGVAFLAYTALVGVLSVLKALNLHLGGGYTKDGVEKALTGLAPAARPRAISAIIRGTPINNTTSM